MACQGPAEICGQGNAALSPCNSHGPIANPAAACRGVLRAWEITLRRRRAEPGELLDAHTPEDARAETSSRTAIAAAHARRPSSRDLRSKSTRQLTPEIMREGVAGSTGEMVEAISLKPVAAVRRPFVFSLAGQTRDDWNDALTAEQLVEVAEALQYHLASMGRYTGCARCTSGLICKPPFRHRRPRHSRQIHRRVHHAAPRSPIWRTRLRVHESSTTSTKRWRKSGVCCVRCKITSYPGGQLGDRACASVSVNYHRRFGRGASVQRTGETRCSMEPADITRAPGPTRATEARRRPRRSGNAIAFRGNSVVKSGVCKPTGLLNRCDGEARPHLLRNPSHDFR